MSSLKRSSMLNVLFKYHASGVYYVFIDFCSLSICVYVHMNYNQGMSLRERVWCVVPLRVTAESPAP